VGSQGETPTKLSFAQSMQCEDIFRIQDKLSSESTRGKKGLALVCLLLFFELFLELGVGLLKIAEIVLEEPRFSRPLQL
jgi:hypothetical protein